MPPWEKYTAPAQDGPWAKYGNAAPLAQPKTFDRDEDEQLYRQTLAEIEQQRSKPMVPQYARGPDGKEIDLNQIPAQELAIQIVQEQRGKEGEQQHFDASRTPFQRVADTSAFIVSAPVRMVTGGKKGLGDVAGVVSEEAGESYTKQEADFARANRWWLEPVAKTAELTLPIPFLHTMGAPVRGVSATINTALNRAQMGRRVRPSPVATPAQAHGPAERIRDRQAFLDEGIPEFAPAFTSKGTARVARTVEEAPLVGGTVKTPKVAVEQAMAERQRNLATQSGAAASQEEVGRVTQRGLERFRGSNLEDLERTRVQALGLPSTRPAPRGRGNVRVDRPSQLDTAGMTEQQLDTAARSMVDLPQSLRTRIEDLTPAQVERVIALPARDTSFATKASALYRRAEDAVPPLMRSNETRNPNLLATRNSQRVVEGMLRQEQAANISGGILEGRFGQLVERLRNPQRPMTLDAMRAARTEVGRALSNFGQFDTRLDRTQLRQLYGAISDDYQSGLVALAARARRASRLQATDPNYIRPAVADAADRALQRYRTADRYFRQGIERMDRFMNVLGAKTMEQASKRIASYLRENTQNVQALESMASALRPEEWRSVLGHVVEQIGRLTPGAREAERVFSFERFATDWNKISQNPRVMNLFRRSLGDQVVDSFENLGRISERMKYYETTRNYSGTAYTGFGGAGMAVLYDPTMWPLLVGSIAGTGLTGKVLTSRVFAQWVNSLNRAQVQVGSSTAATRRVVRNRLRQLGRIAARSSDPEVAGVLGTVGYFVDRQLEAAYSSNSANRQ
jgi:hypothetical protein